MGEATAGPTRPARRTYGHFCGLSRALDRVGDRWSMLIVRELLAGPRRYTDLHADLPGASTDMLAARLRDLESDGLVERRRLPAPASARVYVVTEQGRALLPALTALAAWGVERLHERRPTDAVRVHWHALPLRATLIRAGASGTVDVVTDEGRFHLHLDDAPGDRADAPVYGDGPADPPATTTLTTDAGTLVALCAGNVTLSEAQHQGRIELAGDSTGLGDA